MEIKSYILYILLIQNSTSICYIHSPMTYMFFTIIYILFFIISLICILFPVILLPRPFRVFPLDLSLPFSLVIVWFIFFLRSIKGKDVFFFVAIQAQPSWQRSVSHSGVRLDSEYPAMLGVNVYTKRLPWQHDQRGNWFSRKDTKSIIEGLLPFWRVRLRSVCLLLY